MFCKNCGKEIDENAFICVHCGVKVKEEAQAQAPQKNAKWNNLGAHYLSVAGFILSIVSLYLGMLIIPPILAVVLCAVGKHCAKKAKDTYGLALAGIILGIIELVFWTFVYVLGFFPIS